MEIAKDYLIELLNNELRRIRESKIFYTSSYKVTSVEQVVFLSDTIKDLDTKYEFVVEALSILRNVEFEKGRTFITTYLNKRKYLKFLKDMVQTIKIIGIEIPEGKVTLWLLDILEKTKDNSCEDDISINTTGILDRRPNE